MEYIDGVSLADLLKKRAGACHSIARRAHAADPQGLACATPRWPTATSSPSISWSGPPARRPAQLRRLYPPAQPASPADRPRAPFALPRPRTARKPRLRRRPQRHLRHGAVFYQMITGGALADALPPSRVMHGIPPRRQGHHESPRRAPRDRHPTCQAMIAAINRVLTRAPIARIAAIVFVILALAVGASVLWWW